jgi:quinol monooxygenase YgiN
VVNIGFFVRIEARAGKEDLVEKMLSDALPLAQAEEETFFWYAVKFGPTTFAIFDGFETEEGREIHLKGRIADLLLGNADELLVTPPIIDRWDLVVAK